MVREDIKFVNEVYFIFIDVFYSFVCLNISVLYFIKRFL